MSCKGIVFRSESGEEYCLPVYYEVDIWRDPRGPHPDPWQGLLDDIRTLATINQGIATIANERIRKTMFEAVQGAARSLELPKGVKLGDGLFQGQKAFMAAK